MGTATRARTSPLRVLHVPTRYLPEVGGLESHVFEVSRRLRDCGVDVEVLTADTSGRLPAEEWIEGIRVRRARAYPQGRDFTFAPALYRTIAAGSWDVVHCQGYHTMVPPLAMLAALRGRLPYVLTFHSAGHSSPLRNALRGAHRAALRPLLSRAERLVGVSRFEVGLFAAALRLPPERFAVVPNGSQLPLPEGTVERPAGPYLVSVGRLEKYKGHQRAIAALPYVLDRYPAARLRIAGSGPYERQLRGLAAHHGVAGRVEIGAVPATDRRDMARLLAQASVVLLLSDYEAHPIAVMEALWLRRPVLVADAPGLREIAADGLARSVPRGGSARAVAAGIIDQLERPLAPRPAALPTWDECARSLLDIYGDVVEKRGR